MVGQKYLWEANERLGRGGQKYTKYKKINNNSENFRRARLLPRGAFACLSIIRYDIS